MTTEAPERIWATDFDGQGADKEIYAQKKPPNLSDPLVEYVRADKAYPDIEIEQHLIADKYFRKGLERAAEIVQSETTVYNEMLTKAQANGVAAAIRAEKDKA